MDSTTNPAIFVRPLEPLGAYFFEGFLGFAERFSEPDINVLFSILFETSKDPSKNMPEWWPTNVPCQYDIDISQQCTVLATSLCNFNLQKLEMAFDEDELRGRLETCTSLTMMNDFIAVRKFQHKALNQEWKLTDWVKNIKSPAGIFQFCDCHPTGEHPAQEGDTTGVARRVCERTEFECSEGRSSDIFCTRAINANLEHPMLIEFAIYSETGRIEASKTEALMQIKDGMLRNIGHAEAGRLMNTNVNAAIKACVVKVPIIGELILATIPLQESYIVYSIKSAISTTQVTQGRTITCFAIGWDMVPHSIWYLNFKRKKRV